MFLDTDYAAECSGCTSCAAICPKKAIQMEPDSKGFLRPVIDTALCIECNLCRNVCVFHFDEPWNHTVQASYAVHHVDSAILKRSRSGGAFYALAQTVICNLNGIVWGAAFDEKLNVVHKKITSMEELKLLQGSKYVQSDLGNAFTEIRSDLLMDKEVLFSGTACQVAGLLSYLDKIHCNTSKLLTCDIVCQGVPSPSIYKDYRDYLEKKHGRKLKDFDFRDNARIGWEGHEESYTFANSDKRYYSRKYATYYYHYYMRESCFECKYTGLHRPADFTLADFWGVKEKYPKFYNKDGNSLVLVNTQKGVNFFEKTKNFISLLPVKVEDVLQPRLQSPSVKPDGYDHFWAEYAAKGSEYCIMKYGKESFKSKLVYTIKPVLRKLWFDT